MILSIVIPVYKVEEYVEKCIRSCHNQNIFASDYEIIVVNDGSPDNSLQICEKLTSEIKNLNIISQENRGLSGARNTGLRHSKGEFVWFVDSDDWIEDNCLQDITNQLKKYDSEIFWLGHDVVADGEIYNSFPPLEISKPIDGEIFFVNHLNDLFYIWRFIYKREFLRHNELTFYEGILYEDLEFTPRALQLSKSCITIPKVYYHYLMREGSIVNNFKPKNLEDVFFIIDRNLKFLNNNNTLKTFYAALYTSMVLLLIRGLKLGAKSNLNISDYGKSIIKKIEKKQFLSKSQKATLFLIKLNPIIYVFGISSLYKALKFLKK